MLGFQHFIAHILYFIKAIEIGNIVFDEFINADAENTYMIFNYIK
jgi:hypothetical protein